jgi:hypothetical protein
MRKMAILVVVFVLSACAHPELTPDGRVPNVADAGPPPANARDVIMTMLRARLKDPYSAQIEGISGPKFIRDPGSIASNPNYGWGICFEVNAKNSYGAFTGFHSMAMIWREGRILWVYGDLERNLFDEARARQACEFIRK